MWGLWRDGELIHFSSISNFNINRFELQQSVFLAEYLNKTLHGRIIVMELIFLGYLTFLSGTTTTAAALEAIFMRGLLDARERNNIPGMERWSSLHHSQLELQTNHRQSFHNHGEGPRAFNSHLRHYLIREVHFSNLHFSIWALSLYLNHIYQK